jgi:hypothetical protein
MKHLLQIFEVKTTVDDSDAAQERRMSDMGDKWRENRARENKTKGLPPDYWDPAERSNARWQQGPDYKDPGDPYVGMKKYERYSPYGYGRYGQHTSALQNYMNKLGYRDEKGNPLQLDARYGPKTVAAVDKFIQTLDPNSAEYKILRQLDANAITTDPDTRITPPKKRQTADQGKVDATADQTQSSNYSGQDVRTAGARDAGTASPAQGFPSSTTAPEASTASTVEKSTQAAKPAADIEIKSDSGFTPAQEKWLGKADRTDPFILSRMRSAVPGAAVGSGPNLGVGTYFKPKEPSVDPRTQAVPIDTGMEMKSLDKQSGAANQNFAEELKNLEEELAEMMRLSGLVLTEKAVSKQQQKFMGMVHAMQKGEKVKGASPELKKVAKTMGKKDARDFAKTKHKGLPQKVDESFKLMLDEEGHTLEHIVNRFKHEVKAFLAGDYMAENLYDALYDYYLDRGEMPYGVAKAREGDPYTWVSARFEADVDGTVDVKVPLGEVGHDDTLNELARLAGLSESRVDECGDMGINQQDTINVSTNMSSDGNKSVNISAQGEKAEELLSMLKLAGMSSNDSNDRPPMVVVGNNEEMMDEERETEYANTPEEEYQTVDTIIRQGNDLNREKRQYASKPRLGDNPMAEEVSLEEQFEELYNSVLVKEADPKRPKGDTGIADIYTADKGIPPPSPDEGPVGKAPVAPKQPAAPKAPVAVPGTKR